jgi:GTPase SAR1 family protein
MADTSESDYEGADVPVTPVSIDPEAVTTESLEALQSDEQRKVLDVVDHLRRQGLSGIVELPQIVVCGDQSSGKSSVLEAITEIPFPRNENLCTRFATEVRLNDRIGHI